MIWRGLGAAIGTSAVAGLVAFIFAAMTIGSVADAASLDCASARTAVERVICSSKALSVLDDDMAGAYRNRLLGLSKDEAIGLRWDQQRWLKFRDERCGQARSTEKARMLDAASCLEDEYRDRIDALRMRCEVDELKTIEDMAAAEVKGDYAVLAKVPKGFIVDQHLAYYVVGQDPNWTVRPSTGVYSLPSSKLGTKFAEVEASVFGALYRGLALCRVKAPDGTGWLAERGRGGYLSYLIESDTTPAAQYDEARREDRARRKQSGDEDKP